MKFECLQFVWHGSFFFVNLYAFAGSEWSTLYISFHHKIDDDLYNTEASELGTFSIICLCVVHAASMALLVIILRKGEAATQDSDRFAILYSTWIRKLMLFVILVGYIINFAIALYKTFGENDFRAYNRYSAWINTEAASFLIFIIYFGIVKFQFDLNFRYKQDLQTRNDTEYEELI
mgnify:CR=1 FL=1